MVFLESKQVIYKNLNITNISQKEKKRGMDFTFFFFGFYFFKLFFKDFFLSFFIFGCVGSLLLRAGFFSSCGERGLLFVAVRGLLIAVASLVAEQGL